MAEQEMTKQNKTAFKDKDHTRKKSLKETNKLFPSNITDNYNSDDFDTDLDEEESDLQDKATVRLKKQAKLQRTENSVRYLDMCSKVKAVPCSKFIHQINQSEVNMRHYGLGYRGAKAFALEMLWNRNITKLDLTNTLLGDSGGVLMADMLLDNQHLKELYLADNNIGKKSMKALGESVLVNKTLVSLDLSSNGLSDKLAMPFLTALRKNTSVKELDMSYNELSQQAGMAFGSVLVVNTSLEVLKLRWNAIRLEGATSLGKGLKKNRILRVLDLSSNGLDDESAGAIGESLKFNNTLLELDISNNRLTDKGFEHIAKGMQKNRRLQALKCGHNPVALSKGQDNLLSLIKALQSNKLSALRELHLDEVYPNKEFQDALQDLLQSNGALKVFSGHEKMDSKMDMFLSVKKEKPWARLVDYIIQNDLTVNELFRLFGSTNGVSIDKKKFRKGLETLRVLQDQQIELLMEALHKEGEEELDCYNLIKLVNSYKKYLSMDK